MTNLILIIIALLIITLLWLINLVLVLVSNQNHIQTARINLQESIRSYLDLVPLLLLKTQHLNKDLLKERSAWFNDWHHPHNHWPLFTSFDKKVDQIIKDYELNNPEAKNNKLYQQIRDDLKEREYQIRTNTHAYNSWIIKFRHKLEKKRYQLANKLDFKYGNKTYKLLADF
jgi:hypothetical protein